MKLPTQDNSALIHLGFAVVALGFCCVALFTHDAGTQQQLWQVVFLLVGLWLPSPAQSSTVTTLIQQLMHAITSFALPVPVPAQVATVQPAQPAQPAPTTETDVTASMKAVPKETPA
jgi:hypothetical protein